MRIQLKQNILIVFILLISGQSFSQHEFLVTVNPTNGNFSKIDSLPGVHWIHVMPRYSTFDSQNQRYIFRGEDVNHTSYLYSVDATNGNLVNSALFPILSDPSDNLIELQFDGPLNKLFGLHWDDSEQREYFVSIDPVSGQHTLIDSIPNVHWVVAGSTSYDPLNHRYFFRGQNDDGTFHNFIINSNNGAIISDADYSGLTDASDNIYFPSYDYTLGKTYGLHWDNSNQKECLVSIDISTGYFEVVCEIPGVKWLSAYPNYNTYDSNNHRFFFLGLDSNMNTQLFTIDTQLGQVISSPSFPVLSDPNDNIIELVYDNTTNQLFALHWDNFANQPEVNMNSNGLDINVYPNPFTESCTLKLNKEYSCLSIIMFDSSGKKVLEKSESNSDEIFIHREGLANGAYFISVIADNSQLGIIKMIIE